MMKLISTLNFKGGVGKTTVTWLLARYLVEMKNKTVLVIDADPQMSLTTAVELLELPDALGVWEERFNKWQNEARQKGKTLCRLLTSYIQTGTISVSESPFYIHRPNLYLLPSDEELYWFDMENNKNQDTKGFMGELLKLINAHDDLPKFDYCFADCPPAFNSLSFSIVSHSDLVLVPINPDVFASHGISIMLRGLKTHLELLPPFIVFMNRAKCRFDRVEGRPKLTRESSEFLNKNVAAALDGQRTQQTSFNLLRDVFIPERKGIKDAVAGRRRIPPDLENYFAEVWDEVEKFFADSQQIPKLQVVNHDVLVQSYEALVREYSDKGNRAIVQFVQQHSSAYLSEFVKANALAIPPKASKKIIEENLVAHFTERKIIGR